MSGSRGRSVRAFDRVLLNRPGAGFLEVFSAAVRAVPSFFELELLGLATSAHLGDLWASMEVLHRHLQPQRRHRLGPSKRHRLPFRRICSRIAPE